MAREDSYVAVGDDAVAIMSGSVKKEINLLTQNVLENTDGVLSGS